MAPRLQSIEVPGTPNIPKETRPRVFFSNLDGSLLDGTESDGPQSIHEAFENAVSKYGSRHCLGYRPMLEGRALDYAWMTYREVKQKIVYAGAAFLRMGVERKDVIGLFAPNCPEWIIAEKACIAHGMITVPLYETLGKEAVQFIINQTQMKLILTTRKQLDVILETREHFPFLKTLVLLGEASLEEIHRANSENLTLISYSQLEEIGKSHPCELSPGTIDEKFTIVYTSGTTGMPKGVVLTQRNFMAVYHSITFLGSRGYCLDANETDVHLSYLPLAHVFDRVITMACLNLGAAVGFSQGNAHKILDDIQALRPTFLTGVPRVFQRIQDQILDSINQSNFFASCLFKMAFETKRFYLNRGYVHHWLLDYLIFSKIKEKFGGRIRCLLSGGAPLTSELISFLRISFGCEVEEIYGQTETTGGSCLTLTQDYEEGHVGAPLPCVEVKLVDVPDLNFTVEDQPFPRGEICFRGPAVFKEYYKDPEKTKETIDEDGWVHSGDIGLWDSRGRLHVIDRKKNLFKLAQGEYIAPEKIEEVYSQNQLISQIFVDGDSRMTFLVGLVIPDEAAIAQWAQSNGLHASPELMKEQKVRDMILKELTELGKQKGLQPFEQIKAVEILEEGFSIENQLMTPTMKLKRSAIKEKYKKQLEELYNHVQKEQKGRSAFK